LTIYTNLTSYDELAEKLNVPETFLMALTPEFLDKLGDSKMITRKFIRKFVSDFRITSQNLQNSLIAFMTNDSSNLKPLASALALTPGSLT
jgi:hypothetical protein